MVPACPDLGLLRDIYFSAAVERKNGVDELIGTVKERTRFENELIRGQRLGFFAVVVEDGAGYGKIVNGDYRSLYNSAGAAGEPGGLVHPLQLPDSFYSCGIFGPVDLYIPLLFRWSTSVAAVGFADRRCCSCSYPRWG